MHNCWGQLWWTAVRPLCRHATPLLSNPPNRNIIPRRLETSAEPAACSLSKASR
jgi:hypothetical protein